MSAPIIQARAWLILVLSITLAGLVLNAPRSFGDDPPDPPADTADPPTALETGAATGPADIAEVVPASDLPATAETMETIDAIPEADMPQPAGGLSRQDALIASLTIFVLAIFVGFEVITKVPPTLHTPLMSGSNAISGITIVGAVLMAGNDQSWGAAVLGMSAVAMATINVVGGFLVTDRMLSMFRRK